MMLVRALEPRRVGLAVALFLLIYIFIPRNAHELN